VVKRYTGFLGWKTTLFCWFNKKELQVDIWLANHPFYTKSQVVVDSEGRVERFMKNMD
jgi:ribosomal protein L31